MRDKKDDRPARPAWHEPSGGKDEIERVESHRAEERARERVKSVFAFLDELILTLPVRPGYGQLLQIHLQVGKERAEVWPEMSSIQLPFLVHAAITGDEGPALPVAGACTLLFLGADLFDSILDHELPPEDSSAIEAYAAFGSCFGIAQQLINDAQDTWGERGGQDLSNGKRTFPLVHALSTLRGDGHDRLQELLAAARESTEHHNGVRALLAAAGSPRFTALMVWLYQQQARSHLASASPREPAERELYTLLDQASLLPQPSD